MRSIKKDKIVFSIHRFLETTEDTISDFLDRARDNDYGLWELECEGSTAEEIEDIHYLVSPLWMVKFSVYVPFNINEEMIRYGRR